MGKVYLKGQSEMKKAENKLSQKNILKHILLLFLNYTLIPNPLYPNTLINKV